MSSIGRTLRILHTGAHPADAFDMVGGTLAHHIRRGDEVCVVVFSHGVKSHALHVIEARRLGGIDQMTVDEAISAKEMEVVRACQILGIQDVRFMRFEDDLMMVEREPIRQLAEIIRTFRPDVLITHSPYEAAGLLTAHRVCCEIAMAARSMAHGLMDHDSLPHNIGEVFYMWQHGETSSLDHSVPRFPQILIDVSDVIELKLQALNCLKSQFYPGALACKTLESCNGAHGLHMCVPFCEAFLRHYPQVEEVLPISAHNVRIATQPLEDTYRRLGKSLSASAVAT